MSPRAGAVCPPPLPWSPPGAGAGAGAPLDGRAWTVLMANKPANK